MCQTNPVKIIANELQMDQLIQITKRSQDAGAIIYLASRRIVSAQWNLISNFIRENFSTSSFFFIFEANPMSLRLLTSLHNTCWQEPTLDTHVGRLNCFIKLSEIKDFEIYSVITIQEIYLMKCQQIGLLGRQNVVHTSTYITRTIWTASNVLSYGIDKANETKKDWIFILTGK